MDIIKDIKIKFIFSAVLFVFMGMSQFSISYATCESIPLGNFAGDSEYSHGLIDNNKDNNIWYASDRRIARYDNGWKNERLWPAGVTGFSDISISKTSHIWIVSNNTVYHVDGLSESSWASIPAWPYSGFNITSIDVAADGSLWAAGKSGYLAKWNGSAWEGKGKWSYFWKKSSGTTYLDVLKIRFDSNGVLYAIGNSMTWNGNDGDADEFVSVFAKYDGTSWQLLKSDGDFDRTDGSFYCYITYAELGISRNNTVWWRTIYSGSHSLYSYKDGTITGPASFGNSNTDINGLKKSHDDGIMVDSNHGAYYYTNDSSDNIEVQGGDTFWPEAMGVISSIFIDLNLHSITDKNGYIWMSGRHQIFSATDQLLLYRYTGGFNISAATVTSNSVNLNTNWDGKSICNMRLQRSTDGINFTDVKYISGKSCTDTGLQPSTKYWYRLVSSDDMIISSAIMVATLDTTAPTINSTDPTSGATNIDLNKVITVTFSENISINNSNKIELKIGNSNVNANATANNNVLTITPSSNLTVNTTYTVNILKNAVKDTAGNNFDSDYTFSFTTQSIPVTRVSLNKTTTTINVGAQETLIKTISPSTATNQNVTWSSSDQTVATVDQTGKVTGQAGGTATITVTTQDGGYTAACIVTVNVPVTGVTLDKTTARIGVGQTVTLTQTITPMNASNKNVTWTTSSSAVATVSNGIVTGVAGGTATITVKTVDGNKTASCTIIVDTTPPTISFSPDGGTYEGDVTVAVTCTDASVISNSRYVWTETAILEEAETWINFTDPTKADIPPQTQEGTKYLNIESTDAAGNKATVQKIYTIISKVAVTVKPSSGAMALAGKQGRVVLLNKQGQQLKDTAWGNGSKNIYAVLAYSNGKMLFAGQDGYYQIRDEIGQWKGINLQWRHTGYSIKALAFLNYYDLNRNLIEDVLMAGANGHWQVRNANGILDSARSGKCDIAGVRAVLVRSDNYSFLAGDKGKIAIIKPDVITFHGPDEWSDNTKNIYAMIEGPNKSILFAGQDGKYQIRKPNGQWGAAGIWDNGNTRDIKTLSNLPNGKILMTGEDGYYQVLSITIIANNYSLTKGEKGQYTLTNEQSAHPREDGRVVIVGNDWHRQYYKYSADCKVTVNKVEKHSITLDTQWEGAGFKNGVVEISDNDSDWTVASDTNWNGNWTQVEVKSLNSSRTYYLRIKATMGYPIYYRTKTVTATTAT